MPNTASNSAITMTAMRWRRQMSTNWSIIQQNSATDHDLLARLHAGEQCHLAALLEQWLDRAPLEGPWRGRNEYRRAVVVHEERRARDHDTLDGGAAQGHAREHVGLQQVVGILERDAGLVAARIRLEDVRDKQHLAMQGLARVGVERHLGLLVASD